MPNTRKWSDCRITIANSRRITWTLYFGQTLGTRLRLLLTSSTKLNPIISTFKEIWTDLPDAGSFWILASYVNTMKADQPPCLDSRSVWLKPCVCTTMGKFSFSYHSARPTFLWLSKANSRRDLPKGRALLCGKCIWKLWALSGCIHHESTAMAI